MWTLGIVLVAEGLEELHCGQGNCRDIAVTSIALLARMQLINRQIFAHSLQACNSTATVSL